MITSERKPLKKIFVVEDDLFLQNIISNYLAEEFQTEAFDNCLDALSSLQEGNIPDVIITDLNTPLLDGIGLIEQIKASGFFSSIPIMILSGEESTEKRIKCLEVGAEDYVAKPFNPRELQIRVKLILRRMGKS